MKPYLNSQDEVLRQMNSDSRGLTGQEAKRRLEETGHQPIGGREKGVAAPAVPQRNWRTP